jgi:hypothetical protein
MDWPAQVQFASFGVKMVSPSFDQYRDNPELHKKAFAEFWWSKEGRAWNRKQQSFTVEVRKDGSFEVPAVPPGEYVFRAHVQEKSDRPFPLGKMIGRVEKEVIIGEGDGAFDVGEILVRGR